MHGPILTVLFALILQAGAIPVNLQTPTRVLVVYANDPYDRIKTLAGAVGDGARSVGAEVKVMEVSEANYKRDVSEWADGIALGSGVYNGSPAPSLLEFINSFDFMDHLTSKVGGAFATASSPSAGLESVLSTIERGLRTFGVVAVGGSSWRNAEGTGVIGDRDNAVGLDSIALAKDQGARIAHLSTQLRNQTGTAGIPPPLPGVSSVLNSVAVSLGRAKWTPQTRLHATCEAYCRGWTAAVGCGTCKPSAFSFPGGASMCVHPGPLGTGLLCRMNQTTLEPTGQSCCGVGGPCELPKPSPLDFLDRSQWPGGCCAGGKCGNCAGGSPGSDRFPQLNDTRTVASNRRYFDYDTNECVDGVPPVKG